MSVQIVKERMISIRLPSKELLEHAAKQELSDEQVDDIHRAIEKGVEGQLDWDILIGCAIDEVVK